MRRNAVSTDEENESADVLGQPLRVVGIGASAGGLEAIRELLRHVPFDSMALVVVQHLAPNHDSALVDILRRATKIAVVTAEENMVLEANHVYVIPPNVELALLHGVLHLLRPAREPGARSSIDFFFRTLAEDQGVAAIGVVLSGTGSDGTLGLEAIRAAGGVTFVQEPGSAKYDGMPRSALGNADFCLTPQAIGDELARIGRLPLSRRTMRSGPSIVLPKGELDKLFILIRSAFGTDLAHYKPATVGRRIERRMLLHKIVRIEDYLAFVSSNNDELHALYKDMLISVTHFFRDSDAFDALTSTVLPQILAHKRPGSVVRAWVPACATGEETYSIAICLLEVIEAAGLDVKVQVFGTDLDEHAIDRARRGVYPANIALDVSPERLTRFFVKKDDQYQIGRRVRDAVVFSKHNVLKDAPFSRIDLVSCRNLLIYLEPTAQRNVLRLLHYALNLSPAGFLMLGNSESVGDAPSLFSLVDRRSKIYLKKPATSLSSIDARFGVPTGGARAQSISVSRPPVVGLQSLFDRKVLELYGPSGVVIDENLDILHFRGRTGPFFDPTPGVASLNILRVARLELHMELKLAIQQAQAEQKRVSADVTFHIDGEASQVRIDVVPIQDADNSARFYAVLFQSLPRPNVVVSDAGDMSHEPLASLERRVHELERELAVTREYLQSTLEDKESATEELKASNEELQSSNEELQSTNEELETSKEEMQSANEELTTVNEELQTRMAELGQTTDDLHNLLSGLDNAVLIASLDLRLRRYTASAERLFALIPGDVGRPLGYLDGFFGAGILVDRSAQVIRSLVTCDEELRATNRRWYSLHITPYRTLDHSIRGVIVTVTDIDVKKRAADILRDVGAYAQSFLATIEQPLLIVDERLRIVWANEVFLDAFDLSDEETVGNKLSDLGERQWADSQLKKSIEATVATGCMFRDVLIRIGFGDAGEKILKVSGNRIPASTDTAMVLLSIHEAQHDAGIAR